jgi:hypothetical protein
MSEETLKRINALLKTFNGTFDIEADLVKENGETVAAGLKIKNVKNDGKQFIGVLHETFNSIVQSLSSEHEVIYNEDKGLVIAKKVVVTDYVIEDFE